MESRRGRARAVRRGWSGGGVLLRGCSSTSKSSRRARWWHGAPRWMCRSRSPAMPRRAPRPSRSPSPSAPGRALLGARPSSPSAAPDRVSRSASEFPRPLEGDLQAGHRGGDRRSLRLYGELRHLRHRDRQRDHRASPLASTAARRPAGCADAGGSRRLRWRPGAGRPSCGLGQHPRHAASTQSRSGGAVPPGSRAPGLHHRGQERPALAGRCGLSRRGCRGAGRRCTHDSARRSAPAAAVR
jgi:hypothetical protein